jgi:hypothetical protein
MLQILAQYSSSGPNNVQQATPVVFAGASLVCVAVVAIAVIAFMIFVWGTIFKKAGYSFWMSILMIIPIVQLIWLLVFAFSKWPIQQELESLRMGRTGGYGGGGFPVTPQQPSPPIR